MKLKVEYPFSEALSKNRRGLLVLFLEKSHKYQRDWMTNVIAAAYNRGKLRFQKKQRLKVTIEVYPPNNRYDAANFVDAICDAVKVAIDIDDRWFDVEAINHEVVPANQAKFVIKVEERDERKETP